MLSRRHLLLLSTAALSVAAIGLPFPAQAQSSAASSFVEETGKLLVGVVNGNAPLPQKQAQLASLVEQRVDIAEIAQFCLGIFWRRATPAQQQEYLTLFHRVLINNIGGRLGSFHGVTFAMGRSSPNGADTAVSTVVTRPGNAPNQVQWVISNASGSPKIVDVIAEGTSLRLTQRQDYYSFLTRNGGSIPAFLQALHRQVAAAAAG